MSNNCGCNETTIQNTACNECPPETCTCAVNITTDCVTLNTTDPLSCSGIEPGTILTEAVEQLDAYICTSINELRDSLNLTNVGNGARIYKGNDNIGRRQIRTLTGSGSAIVTEEENYINIEVETINPDLQTVLETGNTTTESIILNDAFYPHLAGELRASYLRFTDANSNYLSEHAAGGFSAYDNDTGENTRLVSEGIYFTRSFLHDDLLSGINSSFILPFASNSQIRRLLAEGDVKVNAGTNTTVTGAGTTASPFIISSTGADGSETKITAGTNISVTGTGSTPSPYVINNTLVVDGSETKITAGTNTTVTGAGTTASPFIISSTGADGSETKINNGITTTKTGNGTIATPYVIELSNPQKEITADYTLQAEDFNQTLFINNTIPITITIPITGLPANFCVGFVHETINDVTYTGSGVTNPIGLKSKGQGYQQFIERKLNTSIYYLLGNTAV